MDRDGGGAQTIHGYQWVLVGSMMSSNSFNSVMVRAGVECAVWVCAVWVCVVWVCAVWVCAGGEGEC